MLTVTLLTQHLNRQTRWLLGRIGREEEPSLSVERASSATPAVASNSADAAVARLVARLSSEFVLRVVGLTLEAFGDMRGGLVAHTILAANTAHFDARAEWGRLAVGSNISFPDEARRPISIGRLAESLGMPFETTRRIVQRLIDEGICVRVDGGVIVPKAAVERPEIVRAVIANVGYVRRFVRDLQAVGLEEAAPFAAAPTAPETVRDTFAARVVARLTAAYLLRALKLLVEVYGDIRDGVIAQTIVIANTGHLDRRMGEGRRYAAIEQTPPDDVRRPISIARLAESLSLPFETTRRHAQRLLDAGTCVRVDGGLIVPRTVLERPASVRAAIANVGYVRKFLRDLQQAERDAVGLRASVARRARRGPKRLRGADLAG